MRTREAETLPVDELVVVVVVLTSTPRGNMNKNAEKNERGAKPLAAVLVQ